MTMTMAAAMVMARQRGQLGQGKRVKEIDASTKAATMTTSARTSMTKEMDGNLISPGDAVQRNRTNDGGGGALDNDNVEYNNDGPSD